MKEIDALNAKMDTFSSPCLGIFFYKDGVAYYKTEMVVEFSSPCLGIFFY